MTEEYLKKAVIKNERDISKITHSILFTNDIAISYCIDAIGKVKYGRYYVYDFKRLCKKAEKEVRAYEWRMNRIVGPSSSLFADANEKFLNFVDNDLKKLYYCIKFEYDKCNVRDSWLFALLRMALELCNLADTYSDIRVKEFGLIDKCFKHVSYSHLRLNKVRHAMQNLLEKTPDVDIEHSENVNLAFDIFLKKIADEKLLFEAIDY